jgi:hypothetical protein
MNKIFIFSCWRSGTSWLEDILGKNVEGSALFGHEQQIFPLLAMYKQCYQKTPANVRKSANRPLDDIVESEWHKEFGLKQHKVLHNLFKYTDEPFESFAMRFVEFLLTPYQGKFEQVVEKSPENLSIESFRTSVDVFGNHDEYKLVYLIRDFVPYLASCYYKFVTKGNHDLSYYANKWIEWNDAAQSYIQLEPNQGNCLSNISNLYLVRYPALVHDPEFTVSKFATCVKKDIKIRKNVLTKWSQCEVLDVILSIRKENKDIIDRIEKRSGFGKIYLDK